MDDITSALDQETQRAIWRAIIASCREESTYLIVSNDPYVIEQADQVRKFEHGRLTANC